MSCFEIFFAKLFPHILLNRKFYLPLHSLRVVDYGSLENC